jgi:hypothetical protein
MSGELREFPTIGMSTNSTLSRPVRSHLREIRDRSVLRLFESNEVAAAPQILSGSPGIPQQLPQQMGHWDQDPVSGHSKSRIRGGRLMEIYSAELLQRARVRFRVPASAHPQEQGKFVFTFHLFIAETLQNTITS